MIIYEITAKVQSEFVRFFETFLNEKHISDLIDTRYFVNAEFMKTGKGVYCICYLAENRESLGAYLENDAKRFREDFIGKFPEGVQISRRIIDDEENWFASDGGF